MRIVRPTAEATPGTGRTSRRPPCDTRRGAASLGAPRGRPASVRLPARSVSEPRAILRMQAKHGREVSGVGHALSKSRFQLGLQCERLLLAEVQPSRAGRRRSRETQRHIFETGTRVGELARERFAGGVLVAEDHLHSAEALTATARLMCDPPPAVFEAAFRHDGVFVRPDALVRERGRELGPVRGEVVDEAQGRARLGRRRAAVGTRGRGAGRSAASFLMHVDNTYVHVEWSVRPRSACSRRRT